MTNQALFMRGRLQLAKGDLTRAAQLFAEVEPRFRRVFPAEHAVIASLTTEQALLAQARGEMDRAAILADRAVALSEADPQATELLARCLVRRSALALQMHRLEAATSDAARAMALEAERTDPNSRSYLVGRVYLTLGRGALSARQVWRREEPRLRRPCSISESTLGEDHPETRSARQLLSNGVHDDAR